jgi:hypothetical protein
LPNVWLRQCLTCQGQDTNAWYADPRYVKRRKWRCPEPDCRISEFEMVPYQPVVA